MAIVLPHLPDTAPRREGPVLCDCQMEDDTRIGVIGSGMIGSTLAELWVKAVSCLLTG